MSLPAHYSIEGICAACGGAIKTGDGRYWLGTRQYHADCFDISVFGVLPDSGAPVRSTDEVS